MTAINEIAPDLFRLSIYVPDFDMQFNHFLVRDEGPLPLPCVVGRGVPSAPSIGHRQATPGPTHSKLELAAWLPAVSPTPSCRIVRRRAPCRELFGRGCKLRATLGLRWISRMPTVPIP